MSKINNLHGRLLHLPLLLLALHLPAERLIAQGSEPLSFSLEEAVAYGMEHNMNAENARLDVAIADQRVWEATASGLPQVSANMNYNYNINLATTLIPDFLGDPSEKIEVQFGTKHYATAGVSANQLVFSGQFVVGLQTARIFKEFTRKNRQRTEQQVREAITQNYYLVLLGQETLDALRRNLDNIRRSYRETRKLYETGFAEEIEADQLEVAVRGLENSVLSMQRQVVSSMNLLKYQMGMEREKRINLTDSLAGMVAELDVGAALSSDLVLEENIEFQILKEQERLALMDLRLKKSEFLPTLSAFYSMDFTAQRDQFNFLETEEDWYRASVVGLSVNIPVFSSGLRRSGLAQKQIALRQASNSRAFAAEGLRVEFLQARYDLANAHEQYVSEKENLEVSHRVVEVTEEKYREGLASSLELTQVNDQYLQTLSNYTSAMVDLLNAKIKMDLILNNI